MWYDFNWPPKSSDSLVILKADRLSVFCSPNDKLAHRPFLPDPAVQAPEAVMTGRLALNANSSSPTDRPGMGWYRVPALATTVRRVVGLRGSREATLMPLISVDSKEAVSVEAPAVAAYARR